MPVPSFFFSYSFLHWLFWIVKFHMKVRISQNFVCFKLKHWPLISTSLTKHMQCHKACDSRMKNASNFDLMVEKKYESKHRHFNYSPMVAAITELWTESQNCQKQNLLFNTKITEFTMIWLICCFHQKRNIYLERTILGGWSDCPVGQKSWQIRDCSLSCMLCASFWSDTNANNKLQDSTVQGVLLTWDYPRHCRATT